MRNQPSPRSEASHPNHERAKRSLVLAAIVTLTAVASTGENAGGSALLYSTYLGGSNVDAGRGIAVDASGNAYFAGGTASANFAVEKVRANNAIIALGAGGQIAVQCDMSPGSTGQTQFLFDVTGFFQ